METINFKNNSGSIKLDEGVKAENFYANIPLSDSAREVEALFESYDYNLPVIPGSFVKIFTLNPKEIAETDKALSTIERKGLKSIFESNLRKACFTPAFVSRVEECLNKGIPFLNPDNTFIKELNQEEDFREYINKTPVMETPINNHEEAADKDEILEARIASMDEFETSIYYSIAEKLNYLILANATNYNLVSILKLAIRRFAEAILNRDYELPKSEMLEKVITEIGIDIESEEAKLILDAVEDIQISVERGRVA